MFKLFKGKDNNLLGNIYVVEGGTYGGDYLVLMEEKETSYIFFVLPDKTKREILIDDFDRGIELKILTFLEKLPKQVFKECKKEFSGINNNIWTSSDQFKLPAQLAGNQ